MGGVGTDDLLGGYFLLHSLLDAVPVRYRYDWLAR